MEAVACAGRLRKLFEEMDAIIDEITTDFVAHTFDLKIIVNGQDYPPLDRAPDDPRDHPIKRQCYLRDKNLECSVETLRMMDGE